MRKLKQMYVNLDRWLEERGEKVIGVIVILAFSALLLSILNVLNGLA